MMNDVGGKRLLFWDELAGELQPLLDLLGIVPGGGRRYGQPKDHVRQDVPWEDREELARALQLRSTMNPTGGDVLMSYLGWADCRMCEERLGTRDLFGYGFVWPEKADHYVVGHKVWTRECAEMLTAVRKPPIGRDVPAEASGGYCEHECPGHDQEPRAGHLWPGELERSRRTDP